MADRYCRNCGRELAEDDRFCPNCGTPVHEAAHVPTPEADRPVPSIPPPSERNAWQRFRYGMADAPEQYHEASSERPYYPPPRDPGIWTGVKLGCGMFIVLPIIIFLGAILFISLFLGSGR